MDADESHPFFHLNWYSKMVVGRPLIPTFIFSARKSLVTSILKAVHGSACGPVIVPVFKTGGRQAILSPVGSTPTRFRQSFSTGK
jgi:hypothetical protein